MVTVKKDISGDAVVVGRAMPPWGLVTAHPKSMAGISSTTYNIDI